MIRETDDPMCTRISAGGTKEVGNYITYRGDLKEVRRILSEILWDLEDYQERPVGHKSIVKR